MVLRCYVNVLRNFTLLHKRQTVSISNLPIGVFILNELVKNCAILAIQRDSWPKSPQRSLHKLGAAAQSIHYLNLNKVIYFKQALKLGLSFMCTS